MANSFSPRIIALVVLAVAATSCSGSRNVNDESAQSTRAVTSDDVPIIGVNSFLWRATLDTIDFMPLESADPYGGVIITDWYANPEIPSERFKATVYILDTRLRADGLKVNIFRQIFAQDRGWVDSPADAETAIQIENAILTRARQLRIQTLER
ncbi:MAG: DUF3576 domain-containing protein [Caulobacterales bacterium]|nr:DUF3576 domain-containing protein [Caulobacterales bacterium]